MPRRLLAALLGLLLSLTLAACGDDDSSGAAARPTSTETDAFPVTITTPAGAVTLEEQPTAVISMSPSATETLFAIGAGDQVIAVDKNSDFPEEVPEGELDAYEPNVEAIAAKEPDLVILSNDTDDLVKQLQALEIPVLLEEAPTEVEGVYEQIEQLGEATGHADEAAEVTRSMRADVDRIVADTDVAGLAYFWELDTTYYSQTSRTFLGKLLALLGLENIADAAGDASDYPQVSAEHIIESDPDLILLADAECCAQSAETVQARPGWGGIKAVRSGGIVELDEDVASRWGPRIVELLQTVAEAAEKVAAAA